MTLQILPTTTKNIFQIFREKREALLLSFFMAILFFDHELLQ